jgi:hypothetical protein
LIDCITAENQVASGKGEDDVASDNANQIVSEKLDKNNYHA